MVTSAFRYLPNNVESALYIVDDSENRPDNEDDTHADYHTFGGGYQHLFHQIESHAQNVAVSGEDVNQLVLKYILQIESLGYGKQNTQNGHGGQQSEISQAGGDHD